MNDSPSRETPAELRSKGSERPIAMRPTAERPIAEPNTTKLDRVAASSKKTLIKVQAWSGLIFSVFLTLHLTNLMAAGIGVDAYNSYMRVMRWYYQFPPVEITLVVGAALVHITAGILQIRNRRRQRKHTVRPTWRIRLHRLSSYVLLAAFAGHVVATRLPSLIGETVNHGYLNFTLSYVGWFFYPYYILLGSSGVYHMTHGVVSALRRVGVSLPRAATAPRSRVFWVLVTSAGVLAVFGVLGLGGVLYAPDQATHGDWKIYFNKLLPLAFRPW